MPKAHPIKILPPREYLRECFDYDPETGALTWKRRPRAHFATYKAWATWNAKYAGHQAGNRNKRGYFRLKMSHSSYFSHRVIWKLMTGDEPPAQPDHANGDQSDNRWENLRPATKPQQRWNAVPRKKTVSGFRGVHRRPSGRYAAVLWVSDHKCRTLGTFDTPEEAASVREVAARELHGEFYRPTFLVTL